MLELWFGVVGTVLALIPILVYIVSRVYYHPKIFLTVGGQQSGTPIPLPSSSNEISVGVGARSNKETIIKEVLLQFSSQEVELIGGTLTTTLDRDFPAALHFSGSWIIKAKHSKLFRARYKVKKGIQQFQIKILVYAKVDESEVSFPFDMIPPKIHKCEFIYKFEVEDFKGNFGEKIKRYGFPLGPGEAIMVGDTIKRKSV